MLGAKEMTTLIMRPERLPIFSERKPEKVPNAEENDVEGDEIGSFRFCHLEYFDNWEEDGRV